MLNNWTKVEAYQKLQWNTKHFRIGLLPYFKDWYFGSPKNRYNGDYTFGIGTPWIYFLYWKDSQL